MEGGWEAERTAVCMEEDSGEDDETTYKNDEWEREKNPKKQHAEPRTSEATAMYALGELFRLSAADFEARIGSLTDDVRSNAFFSCISLLFLHQCVECASVSFS